MTASTPPADPAALFPGLQPGVARPVERWQPSHVGEIDMRIARDGSWHYLGSPIPRPALVRLFAGILRRDPDGYCLVTPAEKQRIRVDDAPFVAVELRISGSGTGARLSFRTNVDDVVVADADHPIRVAVDAATGEPSPYVLVRRGLEALIARPVYYELADLAVERDGVAGVWSSGVFFPIGGS